MDRNTLLASFVLLLIAFGIGCGGQRPIVVGSKNFTEQWILGELIAQQIEGCAHLPVERRFGLGGTLLAHQAIVSGEIDIYPEYTGTALTTVLHEDPAGRTPEQILARVREFYREKFGVLWLDPLGFENTFAMAIPGQLARQRRLRTLGDAARSDFAFRLGVGYEFEQRPDGLSGLLKLYPLKLDGAPRSMDLGLLYKAIEQGQVDMVAGNSTDGQIAAMALTVLEDDRNYFPPYWAAVLVRNALSNTPVPGCLSQLSGRISLEAIRDANRRMEAGSQEAHESARRILEALTQSEGEASAPLPQMNNGH